MIVCGREHGTGRGCYCNERFPVTNGTIDDWLPTARMDAESGSRSPKHGRASMGRQLGIAAHTARAGPVARHRGDSADCR